MTKKRKRLTMKYMFQSPPSKRKCVYTQYTYMLCCSNISSNNALALDILILRMSPLKNVSLSQNRNIVFFATPQSLGKNILKILNKCFYEISTLLFYHSIGIPEKKRSKLSGESNIWNSCIFLPSSKSHYFVHVWVCQNCRSLTSEVEM